MFKTHNPSYIFIFKDMRLCLCRPYFKYISVWVCHWKETRGESGMGVLLCRSIFMEENGRRDKNGWMLGLELYSRCLLYSYWQNPIRFRYLNASWKQQKKKKQKSKTQVCTMPPTETTQDRKSVIQHSLGIFTDLTMLFPLHHIHIYKRLTH